MTAICRELSQLDGILSTDALVSPGGAVTNLVTVMYVPTTYDPDVVPDSVLTRTEVEGQIEDGSLGFNRNAPPSSSLARAWFGR